MTRVTWRWIAGITAALALAAALVVILGAPYRLRKLPGTACELLTLAYRSPYGKVEVTAVRFDPAKFRLGIVDRRPRAGGKEAADRQPPAGGGALATEACRPGGTAINASFFTKNRAPIGLIIDNGKKCNPLYTGNSIYGAWGVLLVRQGRPAIVDDSVPVPLDTELAIQCGPRLLIAGTVPSFVNTGVATRSAVGIDERGRLLFIVAAGPAGFDDFARVLRNRLKCTDALNLDGGPSAQLTVRGTSEVTLPGGYPVPILLTAEPK